MKNYVECVSCGVNLPEQCAREVDELYKTLPSECTYQRKAVGVEMQFEPGERAEVSILTNATVDKTNEIVLPEGVNLESYRKSLIVLWNHDVNQPVGKCQWIKLHKGDIRAKTIYPVDEESEWGARVSDVWAMTKSGVLRAKSIGFLPLSPKREPTAEELELNPDWAGAGIWEKSLLLEYSCVAVGANHDALTIAVNTKSVDPLTLAAYGLLAPVEAVQTPLQAVHKCKCEEVQVSTPKPARKPKRAVPDVYKLLAEAIQRLDPDAVVKAAWEAHRNRGRV